MATIQALLDDINLRYKNTFTTAQILAWMNEEQQELFQILEIESAPYSFPLVADTYFYPIPTGVDIDRIKTLTLQIDDNTTPDFEEIRYLRNDDSVDAFYSQVWYTIVENNFFFNIPGGPVANRLVYIYCDTEPDEISSSNLSAGPSVPVRYQELLKLGTLKRIAGARKDVAMQNNYAADYESKVAEMEWKMKMQEPAFIQPTSSLPRRSQNVTYYNNWG